MKLESLVIASVSYRHLTPKIQFRPYGFGLVVRAHDVICSFNANAAILEADEDDELMEKVKRDRKKRLERQGIINSSTKEKGYLQDLVYKLSKVGQAIEKNDLSAASSVLGQTTDADWVQKVNSAFNKFSGSDEEKTQIDSFNSSLSSLVSSVTKNDIEGSKTAFVASASAFEKWSTLTGLIEELKGL
ncbi:Thylakoid lumenal 16.5 kDa protein, chloroplastic [Capsicum chinense]|nr:Thylakoid lumenal 16.5 kDa protein, chloroplastic [Capsicum chinense]